MLCPDCGATNLYGSRFCSSCGTALKQGAAPDSPPAPPSSTPPATHSPEAGEDSAPGERPSRTPSGQASPVPRPSPLDNGTDQDQGEEAAKSPEIRIAGMLDRFIALILDSTLIVAVFVLCGMCVAVRWGGVTESGFSLVGIPASISFMVTTLFAVLYYWLMEGLFGATIGKMAAAIRVTGLEGEKCGLGNALVRTCLRIFDGLFFYLLGFLVAVRSPKKQRIGDHLAKTLVIKNHTGWAVRITFTALWLLLNAGATFFAWTLHRNAPHSSVLTEEVLEVDEFEFLESRDGAPRLSKVYRPGDTIFTRYTVAGYEPDEQERVNLRVSIEVTDPGSLTMVQWKGNLNRKTTETEAVRGLFQFELPPFIPPGTCQIRITLNDDTRDKVAERLISFNVDAPQPLLTTGLELQNMKLSLSEGGPPASAAVPRGSTVYLNARLTGLRFSDNRVCVRMAFQLVDPNGEVIIDRPEFILINEPFDYRPPGFFLPLSWELDIPDTLDAGTYTQRYEVTDLAAGSSEVFERPLDVE